MARWDYGLCIHQGPLYTTQNRSSHSLTFHDEYNFSSQCHSSAQNCSVSFCIIVLSLEIEYLHNLLPHLASCCILPSWTQTEIWNMFYTVSKVVSPFLYLGYSLCPKSQLPFQFCFSTCRFCDYCLLMTHRVYCHHLHNIFWSSIFTHSVQARCEMRFSPPFLLLLLSSVPQGLSQQCICICLISVFLSCVIHDSSCTCFTKTFLGWNWEEFFWLGHSIICYSSWLEVSLETVDEIHNDCDPKLDGSIQSFSNLMLAENWFLKTLYANQVSITEIYSGCSCSECILSFSHFSLTYRAALRHLWSIFSTLQNTIW